MLLILTVAIVVAVLAFYYVALKPVASCTDNIKNQSELGVDCGGPCAKVCAMEVVPIITFWSKSFKVQGGYYDVAALVENSNVGFEVQRLEYAFKLYDSKSILIAERDGMTYANDKERFVIFEPKVDTGNRLPSRVVLELTEPLWSRTPKNTQRPTLSIDNKSLTLEPLPKLTATISNQELYDVQNLDIEAVVYDDKGTALAVSSTGIDTLAKSNSAPLIFTWPEAFSAAPAVTEIYPRVHGVTTQ